MTLGELEPLLCNLGCDLVWKVIKQIEAGTEKKQPQNHALATLAPKITAQEEIIDWSRPAQDLHNLVRALSPLPGAWCKIRLGSQEKRLKIKRSIVEGHVQGIPGTILSLSKEDFIVACGEGGLRLIEVQLEGKKTMPAADFIKGDSISPFPSFLDRMSRLQNSSTQQNRSFEALCAPASSPTLSGMVSSAGDGQLCCPRKAPQNHGFFWALEFCKIRLLRECNKIFDFFRQSGLLKIFYPSFSFDLFTFMPRFPMLATLQNLNI